MLPDEDEVELCHAQYCVPKPEALLLCAVAITYCTVLLATELVLPKCPAALTASAASCDWVGCCGAAVPLSLNVPTQIPLGFPAAFPAPLQKTVPLATPWQYCVTLFSQLLPPTSVRKLWTVPASPDGSLPPPHCEPQRTR